MREARKRQVGALTQHRFDLVIVGGGIFGACAAWDAVLRGMTVALIEKADFGGGASANCFKVAHGGIRYMQHLDFARVRHSSHERSAMIRVAPHLVQPVPIAIPTYGHGRTGKAFLRTGTVAYDLVTSDRNRRIRDPERRVPNCRSMSRSEILDAFPSLPKEDLTGAVVMFDGQFFNPPRLVYAFVASSVARGALAVNYVKATSVKRLDYQDMLVHAQDASNGEAIELRARTVLNTAGPWAEELINSRDSDGEIHRGTFSRDLCFVIPGQLNRKLGLAVQGSTGDPDAVLGRPKRHLFLLPWRDYTLVGVWHKVYKRSPDDLVIEDWERQNFVDEIVNAYPGLALEVADVKMWNTGLVPFGEEQSSDSDLSYGKRSRFVDHARNGGPDGLFSLIGVRYTMGRGDSAIAMKAISRFLRHGSVPPPSDRIPLLGADFESFSALRDQIKREMPGSLSDKVIESLAKNHGSEYSYLLDLAKHDPSLLKPLPNSTVLAAEIAAAARRELCLHLSDIVFRRTDLATAGKPDDAALQLAARIAAKELGWDPRRTKDEYDATLQQLPYGCATLSSQLTPGIPQ